MTAMLVEVKETMREMSKNPSNLREGKRDRVKKKCLKIKMRMRMKIMGKKVKTVYGEPVRIRRRRRQ